MKAKTINTECVKCKENFVVFVDYYRNRGYNLPKTCPRCRGRDIRTALFEGDVILDIPEDKFFEKKELYHYTRKKQRYFAGIRYKIRGNKVIVFYDITKVKPKFYHCRIMQRDNGYIYVVLDYPVSPKPNYKLQIQQNETGSVFFKRDILEVVKIV